MAERFVALGTRKIRLTGGEPLVRQGIVELCGRDAILSALPLKPCSHDFDMGGKVQIMRFMNMTGG